MDVFHLAIPTHDLDAAESFYTGVMHARRARRYEDRVTFRFFDHQLVCHLDPESVNLSKARDPFEKLYPRHFGITFESWTDFDSVYRRCIDSRWPYVKTLFERFSDLPERHQTFFVADSSFNLLEFKHYDESKYMY